MGNVIEFRTEPGEVQDKFEELVIGSPYRVWTKAGGCVIEWTSVLADVEVIPQPDLNGSKVSPFFLLKFENGVRLQSRTGWTVSFYRVPIIR